MTASQAADILEEIDPDDATDIYAELEQGNPASAGTIPMEMESDQATEMRRRRRTPSASVVPNRWSCRMPAQV
jgi:hypothetical protein